MDWARPEIPNPVLIEDWRAIVVLAPRTSAGKRYRCSGRERVS
jgi:hypothetical protein